MSAEIPAAVTGMVLFAWVGEGFAFHDVDLGAGDAAAVDGLYVEGCAESEGAGCVVEDLGRDAGVEESA